MQYNVMRNVLHDGKAFARRDTIELEEGSTAAVALLASGAISETALAPEPVKSENRDLVVEKPKQPEVGGTRTETGEPSLDGRDGDGVRKEATDVSPVIATVDMKRDELEAIAREKGIEEAAIEAAPNKGALVDLITTQKPADESTEPDADPSANL